ncbi:catabolite control protein A [Sphingomonas mucosissima]|uniref:Catabolite control protein A n=1 Tax=Sphingomonas mucosissima TaxID=370959 RepID=A0A245ZJM3_9SPHN|nr:catabolite control protein A [Sphingomonas mucosissima]
MVQSSRPRRSTLADIAAIAGVSIKTASRVIRREPVANTTRERVERAVKELGYRPITAPRSAASDRSYLIGLLHFPPVATFVSGLIMGASERARQEGYHLVVEACSVGTPEERARSLRQLVIQSNLDAMILAPPLGDDPIVLATLADLQLPTCSIAPGDTDPDRPSVAIDDRGAAREVTKRLLDWGHRHIAFLTGAGGRSTTARRLAGFQDAVSEMPEARATVVEGDYSFRSGFEAGQKLLWGKEAPTAVFASNDEMAAGILVAAHKLGLAMPGQLSVFGFDDDVIANAVWPPLSTVRQPVYEMGGAAVTLLVDSSLRPSAKSSDVPLRQQIPYEIIERETSGRAPRS